MATYIEIASVTIGSGGASTLVFSSIPSTYTDLQISLSLKTNRGNAVDAIGFYFNTDTTSGNYSIKNLNGTGSAVAGSSPPYNDEYMFVSGDGANTNTFGNSQIYISNYAGSEAKSASIDSVGENNATTAYANFAAYKWTGTAAINQITFFPISGTGLLQYSTAYLYGIKKG